MSVFMNDDNEDKNDYKRMVILCIAASSFILLLFLTVMYVNMAEKRRRQAFEESLNAKKSSENNSITNEDEDLLNIGEDKLVSSDLDFWNTYKNKNKKNDIDTESDEEGQKQKINDFVYPDELKNDNREYGNNEEELEEASLDDNDDLKGEESSDSEYDDGKHIGIVDKNGKKMWYEISDILPKNIYDLKYNLTLDGQKLSYRSPQTSSVFGIDVSKYQGDIDWEKVKGSGVDFAMIRSASRGYGSGVLAIDDKFVANIEGAKKNNIAVGVYVFSQAVNEIEAVEEANFAVASVMNYGITFPIACDVEEVENDTARADKLSIDERTRCVKTFCDTVKNYGYKPVIYASKEFLITKLNLEDLSSYDIWLRDTSGYENRENKDINTDFPYQFTMWQYTDSGTVNGISGSVDLNISFVNYIDK